MNRQTTHGKLLEFFNTSTIDRDQGLPHLGAASAVTRASRIGGGSGAIDIA